MGEDRGRGGDAAGGALGRGLLGTLKDALAAAGRDETSKAVIALPAVVAQAGDGGAGASDKAVSPSAAEAAREARANAAASIERHVEADAPPTTRVLRAAKSETPARTQLVRGKAQVARGEFHQDPVVGWLVIVGGPGMGAFRPIFEGNNTVGRAASQRIALDFGDDAISSEEQAYIRYDSAERSFLFVPNLAKTNVVSVNNKRPTAAVTLNAMDVITIGRTQVVFVPFCGAEFDWAEIADANS